MANAKGALAILGDWNVSAETIEHWVPQVMRFAFRLTPVNTPAPAAP